MHLRLPTLERIVYQVKGDKNIIKQLIEPGFDLPASNIEIKDNCLFILHDNKRYCFTHEETSNTNNYLLLINALPTVARLNSGLLYVKKWLKHPLLNNSHPDDITATWKDQFFFKEENLTLNQYGLRQPQIGAIHMILGHLTVPLESAIVVLPTGTGKTETMLSALVALPCKRILVVVPSDSLRNQIAKKFITLGLLKSFGIIGPQALYPIVGVIKQGFSNSEELKLFFEQCNVIVTTMNILSRLSEEDQSSLSDVCSCLFLDEAHHVKARTWDAFKNKFPAEKIVQFTATPFRNDGQRIEGRIIFNFPLKKAQEQGYFKKIQFLPIREYERDKADILIAQLAIQRLREDIAAGYEHILMARCENKERANMVYELYRTEADLKPVLLYSGVLGFRESYERILSKEARIIVCVDMLGEGFDLPELKIAAFHDIRKSLPITLQFAGRFTRSSHDAVLGQASFIANIADLTVRAELAELYALDADWNQILSDTSFGRIEEEEDYKNLMNGFPKINTAQIPFHTIDVSMSAVVFRNKTTEWFPLNFKSAITKYDELDYKFYDLNRNDKLLIIITARKEDVDWIDAKDMFFVDWQYLLIFWETRNNLLFINSSDNGSLYSDLAEAIIGENAELIRGINVFRTFANLKRTRLQNVGLKYHLGKNERFRMSVGSDVAEALAIAERQKGEKAFVMGVGYEEGESVNIGASYKGRVWSKLSGDFKDFIEWCTAVGNKLADESIDPNQILRETLIPVQVTAVPALMPVWIDWDIDLYISHETKFKFIVDGKKTDVSTTDIELFNPTLGGDIEFNLVTLDTIVHFRIALFENTSDPENRYPDFKIELIGTSSVDVIVGTRVISAVKFFEEFTPTVWFADGSSLTGNDYIQLLQSIGQFRVDKLIAWDWTGVDISKESQGVHPKRTDSIQYKVIQHLVLCDVDIVYDDDYSGEIADVVTLKYETDKIKINLYHLKFALDGKVSNQIKNFYEVCGQAQKSVHWRHKEGTEFINHLLRRETKVKNGQSCSRIQKGSKRDIEKLLKIVKNEIPVEFEVFIVQPGASVSAVSNDILMLLGVTENFLKEVGGINLQVILNS
ncbi:MAG: DEAD/DEAH box helicase family protein [Agriterribacter sp.]